MQNEMDIIRLVEGKALYYLGDYWIGELVCSDRFQTSGDFWMLRDASEDASENASQDSPKS